MKKAVFSALILSIFAFLIVPDITNAAVIRANGTVNVDSEEVISENLYITGGQTTIEGKVEGDLSVASGDVFLRGEVSEDVVIIGGDIEVTGTINGDLRVIGGELNVSGTINGDLVLIGGKVKLLSNSNITGDILLVGGKLDIEGDIKSKLRAIGGNINLKGNVDGEVTVTTQNLILESGSKVSGTLNYFSPNELQQNEDVNISGTVNFNRVESVQENGVIQQAIVNFLNFWILLRFITTLLLTFLIVYIFKVFSQKTTEFSIRSFLPSFITGILVAIALPVVSLVAFISLILLPISILLILTYIFVLVITTAVASIAVGALIKRAFLKEDVLEVSFSTASIGVVILTLLQFVPFVGEITRFVFFMAAFGAIWKYIYSQIRWGYTSLFNK